MMLFLQKMFAQFFFLLIMFHYKIEDLLWRVLNDDNIVGLFHVLLLLHKYSRYDSHLNEEYRNTPNESTESEREPLLWNSLFLSIQCGQNYLLLPPWPCAG